MPIGGVVGSIVGGGVLVTCTGGFGHQLTLKLGNVPGLLPAIIGCVIPAVEGGTPAGAMAGPTNGPAGGGMDGGGKGGVEPLPCPTGGGGRIGTKSGKNAAVLLGVNVNATAANVVLALVT